LEEALSKMSIRVVNLTRWHPHSFIHLFTLALTASHSNHSARSHTWMRSSRVCGWSLAECGWDLANKFATRTVFMAVIPYYGISQPSRMRSLSGTCCIPLGILAPDPSTQNIKNSFLRWFSNTYRFRNLTWWKKFKQEHFLVGSGSKMDGFSFNF
jgi:hypothetical protein